MVKFIDAGFDNISDHQVFQALAGISSGDHDEPHLDLNHQSSDQPPSNLDKDPSPEFDDVIDTFYIDWGSPRLEQVHLNFQHPGVKLNNARMTPISQSEVIIHTHDNPELRLLRKWISGVEDDRGGHPTLFEWFLARQKRLAELNGIVCILDKPI